MGTEESAARKPFAAFVQEQRGGTLAAELGDALQELVTAVQENGKSGTLTLQVKVASNGDDLTVTVTDKITVKKPEPARGAAIFYIDVHGNLVRRNPMQPELPLQGLDGGKGAAPEGVDPLTGEVTA